MDACKAMKASCPIHGRPKHRKSCAQCNAAYMRDYLRKRGEMQPEWPIWLRAQKRASKNGLPFNIPLQAVVIPVNCPVLDVPLVVGQGRTPQSPSLDRIVPARGYVVGNTRVISDRANRLKGALDLVALKARAKFGPPGNRNDYAKVVEYVEREELLAEIRRRSETGGRAGAEWSRIADWLERQFAKGR